MEQFGPVRQNGYVVEDLDAAVRRWIDVLGVGPFFKLPETTFANASYRGVQSRPTLAIAIANIGDLQIELIQQTDDTPSIYLDFLRDHGPGMQHMCCWSTDFDADRARLTKGRPAPVLEGTLGHGPRFLMFDGAQHGGAAMEVLEALPGVIARAEEVRLAALDWDGSDPIRAIVRRP